MSLANDFQSLLDAADHDAIEDAWLAHLEEEPHDFKTYSTAARGLDKAGEGERARFLLEMVDEGLRERGQWRVRLTFLQAAGNLLFEPGDLHPVIVRTLHEIYGSSESFAEMADKVGLHRAIDDLPKTWKKVERLMGLMRFDVGSIVSLEGQGAGRVEEVNMALESFKVKLASGTQIQVGFGGAAKLLTPLDEDHVLRRKYEAPEALERLRDGDPPGLLRIVLESYDGSRTGAEVKKDLAGIVADKKWSSFWAAARKHPQVLSDPGRRNAYKWAASRSDAHGAVWASFEEAEPRQRMDLLRQNSGRAEELKKRMSDLLAEDGAAAKDDDPGLACEIFFQLEKYGAPTGEVPWSPTALIATATRQELSALFAGMSDRIYRERAYEIARDRRSDWPERVAERLLEEREPRSLDVLGSELEADSPELWSTFYDQLLSQPRRSPPAFTWLAERAKDKPDWLARNPGRLLKQILWALNDEAFSPFRTRLEPLTESGGTLPRLLHHLSEDQAEQAGQTLEKTAALVDYQREPLLNALYLKFPGLRKEEEAPLYATPGAISRKHEELRHLVEEEIPSNRRAIEEAREMGDLRENFEYKSARERHEYLSARASALDHDLRRARPIDPSAVTGKEVVIGSRVELENAAGRQRKITILGPWDSRPEDDVLANESEIAKGLLGSAPGEEVSLDDGKYRIVDIEPWE